MNSAAIETTGVVRASTQRELDVREGKEAAFPFVLLSCHSVKATNLRRGRVRKKLGEPEIIIRSSSEKEIK